MTTNSFLHLIFALIRYTSNYIVNRGTSYILAFIVGIFIIKLIYDLFYIGTDK